MPGHKGKMLLGFEPFDITEIKGADSLYEANGIIKESEENASSLFGSATFYSAEGSSLCIRAMVYLLLQYALENGKEKLILAGRNAHKVFIYSLATVGMDVEWAESCESYLSCKISPDELDLKLCEMEKKPCAVYITSPDYLGNISDISALSAVCKKHGVLLCVDNAHGAYLKFLKNSLHPCDLGADMCCDSAHKTLPVITGGAYLHINGDKKDFFCERAKNALSLFGSTSPSYLILSSLDAANSYLENGYRQKLDSVCDKTEEIKGELEKASFTLCGDEALKICIYSKTFGYKGNELADILSKENIECEFFDPDYVVLMLSPENTNEELEKIREALLSVEKLPGISEKAPLNIRPKKAMNVREAVFSNNENISVKDALGRVLSSASVSCPPAVPVAVCGEIIDENTMRAFSYYGIDSIKVVKE